MAGKFQKVVSELILSSYIILFENEAKVSSNCMSLVEP